MLILSLFYGIYRVINRQTEEPINSSFELSDCFQSTCYGVAGYSPIGFPSHTKISTNDFWNDISDLDIYGIHTGLSESGVLNEASISTSIPLILLISHEDIYDLELILEVLNDNHQIKFLGIGNEINLLYESVPEEYTAFHELASTNFPLIKEEFPNIKLLTVFQYESLLGNAFLMGNERESKLHLIKDWEPLVDIIGLTVYPYFDHMHPDELPADYFAPILSTTSKPIAITETSWPSAIDVFSGDNEGFNSDEKEQEIYAKWIKVRSIENNFIFTNWLFLNDISLDQPLFNGSALRDSEGIEKPAYSVWIGE